MVGGNFIGTEAAASLKDEFKEADVNIITMGNVLYERIFGDKIGHEIQKFVKNNGVNTITNRKVKEVKYDGDKKILVCDDG